MIEIAQAARADLERRVLDELGWRVTRWSPVAGGNQNRLFRVDTQDGPALLAKFYHQDRWDRLHREFSTLALLGRVGLSRVPRAYIRSDAYSYAIYSFEKGVLKKAEDMQPGDLLATATFAAGLHRITPTSSAEHGDLPAAVDASLCVADQIKVIDNRLRYFEDFAAGGTAYDEVREFCRELDLRGAITELIERASAGLNADERVASLPRSAWRLNTADFGPQNLLFADDGALTAVDFEASGWDDPARLVMGFVSHATSMGLTAAGLQMFLGAYADACVLSAEEKARFERVGALFDVEWIAIYASALHEENVAAKEFARHSNDFDRHTYLVGAIAGLKRRLARATDGAGYKFA